MARIVIVGCGDVGCALGLQLLAYGHQVWGLRRQPQALPSNLNPLAADLNNIESLHILPPDLDAVIYTAAAGGYTPERYQAIYVDGLNNVIQTLRGQRQSLQRLIFVSSTSVYGQQNGEWVNEDSAANAQGFAAERLRTGEQLALNSPWPATIIRFGGIYGPGRTRLLDSIRTGTAQCKSGLYTNRIHRDDCAAAIAHVLHLEQSASLYLGVDDAPAEQCEVMSWLAQRLGVNPPGQKMTEISQRPRSNKRCCNARLRDTGFVLRYPSFREGYQGLL